MHFNTRCRSRCPGTVRVVQGPASIPMLAGSRCLNVGRQQFDYKPQGVTMHERHATLQLQHACPTSVRLVTSHCHDAATCDCFEAAVLAQVGIAYQPSQQTQPLALRSTSSALCDVDGCRTRHTPTSGLNPERSDKSMQQPKVQHTSHHTIRQLQQRRANTCPKPVCNSPTEQCWQRLWWECSIGARAATPAGTRGSLLQQHKVPAAAPCQRTPLLLPRLHTPSGCCRCC